MNRFNEIADVVEQGWIQGSLALNSSRQPIDPRSTQAECWCVMGAISKVINDEFIQYQGHLRVLSNYVGPIVGWNDMFSQTQENVVATLRKLANEPL